jgi:hypothetical protein
LGNESEDVELRLADQADVAVADGISLDDGGVGDAFTALIEADAAGGERFRRVFEAGHTLIMVPRVAFPTFHAPELGGRDVGPCAVQALTSTSPAQANFEIGN